MIKYKKIFIDYWGYTIADYIPCACCNSKSIDIHHLIFKSQGGKDEPDNLISLCRECHNKAHADTDFNNHLKQIHANNIERFTENKS